VGARTTDYAASKAGVISLVRSAARPGCGSDHGQRDLPRDRGHGHDRAIHVDRARLAGVTPAESLASLAATIPLGRIETAEDVANAVAFLLSAEGSYITSQALNVCGGLEFN
jgi:NAD(P)-dependent dehydrogenase (short-subunit alcohol dehydrogenase family)